MPTPDRAAQPSAPPLIHARSLTKRFGSFTAVDSIDFDVAPGEAFGFLGPNGAGKTSTMRMIGTVSPVTSGELRVFGLDPKADGANIRTRIGVVPQADTLDNELSVLENLMIYGRYFDLPWREARRRATELLEFVQLAERAGDEVEPLSGGMKRRLVIARALINDPQLLLLDEPTTGLDPQARHLLWERLYRLKHRGVTLVLTTHYMDEAEQLCDRLVVMDKAHIVAEGSPRSLIEQYVSREVVEMRLVEDDRVEVAAGAAAASHAFADELPSDGRAGTVAPADRSQGDGELDGRQREIAARLAGLGERIEFLPDRLLLYTSDGEAAAAAAFDRGLRLEGVFVRRATLEDVFLRLTGRSLIE